MLNLARVLLPLLLLLSTFAGPLSADGDEDAMDCAAVRLADLGGELFISVRHYSGVDPDDFVAIHETTRAGFVPIISESPGFVLYALSSVEPDQVLAVNIFQSQEEMQASSEKAADFVAENLEPLLPEAPQIHEGDITVLALAGHCDEAMADDESESMADDDDGEDMDDAQPLFLSFRHYTGVDPDDVPKIAELVAADFVEIISDSEGFHLYLNAAGGFYAALNVFASEEEMTASNEKARDFVAEALAELLPIAPTITNGDTHIFHVADLEALMAMEEEGGYQ